MTRPESPDQNSRRAADGDPGPTPRRVPPRYRKLRFALTGLGIVWAVMFAASVFLQQYRPPSTRLVVVGQEQFAGGMPGAVAVRMLDTETGQPLSGQITARVIDPVSGAELSSHESYAGDDGRAVCTFQPPTADQLAAARAKAPADSDIEHSTETAGADNRVILRLSAETGNQSDDLDWPIRLVWSHRLTLDTDRTVYRGGRDRRVRMRLAAMFPTSSRPAAGLTVMFRVFNRDGIALMQRTARTSDFGIASMEYPLGLNPPEGPLLIEANVQCDADSAGGQAVARTAVRVQRGAPPAKAPPRQLRLTTDQAVYRPGQRVQLNAEVADDAGLPVAGETVHIHTPTNQYALTTDTRGRASQTIVAAAPVQAAAGGAGRLSVRAEVHPGGIGSPLVRTLDLAVAADPIILLAATDGTVQSPHLPVRVRVLARDPIGRPVPDVRLRFQGRQVAVTDADGAALATFGPGQLEQLTAVHLAARIEADGPDLAGIDVPLRWAAPGEVRVVVPSPVLPPAGRVPVAVDGLHPGEQALLELRWGDQVLATGVWAADDAGHADADFAVPAGAWGLLRIDAYRLPDAAEARSAVRSAGQAWVWVARSHGQLRVVARGDRHTYAGQPSGRLFLRVLDEEGKPFDQAVALSLGGFDLADADAGPAPPTLPPFLASNNHPALERLDLYRGWMTPGLWQAQAGVHNPATEQALWLSALGSGLYSSQWPGQTLRSAVAASARPADRAADPGPRSWMRRDSAPVREAEYRRRNRRFVPPLIIGYCLLGGFMLLATALSIQRQSGYFGPMVITLYLLALVVASAGVLELRLDRFPPPDDDGVMAMELTGVAAAPATAGDVPPADRVQAALDRLAAREGESPDGPDARRRSFLWRPQLVTDLEGMLELPFAPPATPGRWRVQIAALARDGRHGRAEHELRTAAPLRLRLQPAPGVEDAELPELLPGDVLRLGVAVENHGPRRSQIFVGIDDIESAGDGISPVGRTEQTVTVDPGQAGVVRFDLRANRPGRHTLQIGAQSASNGSDTLKANLPVTLTVAEPPRTGTRRIVLPAETPVEVALSGSMPDAETSPLPALIAAGNGAGPLGNRADHWSARVVALASAVRMAEQVGQGPQAIGLLRSDLAAAYARLLEFRAADGGFVAVDSESDKPDAATTARALLALTELDDATWRPDGRVIDDAVLWLRRTQQEGRWVAPVPALQSPMPDSELADALLTAEVCWAMARGQARTIHVQDPLNWAAGVYHKHPRELLLGALLCHALADANRTVESSVLLGNLIESVSTDAAGPAVAWFEPDSNLSATAGLSPGAARVLTTALLARAMQRHDTEPDLVARCRRWLLTRRAPDGGWETDRATFAAAAALAARALRPADDSAARPAWAHTVETTFRDTEQRTAVLTARGGAAIATLPGAPAGAAPPPGLTASLGRRQLAIGQTTVLEIRLDAPAGTGEWTLRIRLPAGLAMDAARSGPAAISGDGVELLAASRFGQQVELDVRTLGQSATVRIPLRAGWAGQSAGAVVEAVPAVGLPRVTRTGPLTIDLPGEDTLPSPPPPARPATQPTTAPE